MKEIRIGIFGMKRGSAFIDHILANNGNIVAVCDKDPDNFEQARTKLGDSIKYFTNFGYTPQSE
jgi:predicted dehydrogenase